MQLLNKAGLLSVPSWYSAGKVAQDSSNIPFGASTMLIFAEHWSGIGVSVCMTGLMCSAVRGPYYAAGRDRGVVQRRAWKRLTALAPPPRRPQQLSTLTCHARRARSSAAVRRVSAGGLRGGEAVAGHPVARQPGGAGQLPGLRELAEGQRGRATRAAPSTRSASPSTRPSSHCMFNSESCNVASCRDTFMLSRCTPPKAVRHCDTLVS